jgi:preprotein translocase subunit SecG
VKDKVMNIMLVLWIVSIVALAVVSHLAQEEIDKAKVEKNQTF